MKQHLDESRQMHANALATIEEMKEQMVQAGKDVQRFKEKHDEMFKSVSGLNARIEELEQHKLHLLNKLKGYGDRGDLGYIVKTQKLETIKAKELEDRVTVEAYNPEAGRKQKDAEFDQKMKEREEAGIEDDENYDPGAK